ncbi:hypothetical protein BgiMline_021568 [Biomphalaria glabrata]|nr:hypothetical protein BgiMline_028166 [Biomphalaria glabrata]
MNISLMLPYFKTRPSQDNLSDQAATQDLVGNKNPPNLKLSTHVHLLEWRHILNLTLTPTPRVIHPEPCNPTSQHGYITGSGGKVRKPNRYNE